MVWSTSILAPALALHPCCYPTEKMFVLETESLFQYLASSSRDSDERIQ